MSATGYYWDSISLEHLTSPIHVERPERAGRLRPETIRNRTSGLDFRKVDSHDASKWVLKVHEPAHHERVKEAHARGARKLDEGDTLVSARSYAAALAAVDAALTAADAVVSGEVRNAFCAVRPPGHHAYPFKSMGFCLFATAAILTRYLQERHRLRRVAIVDWDVHHGNGTQNVFWTDPEVLFVSIHQSPLWPGSGLDWEKGEGEGEGATLNLTMPPGMEEEPYLSRFEGEVLPALQAFRPEFLVISAGFDAHRGDPLGGLRLTEEAFARMTRMLKAVAAECCQGQIVSLLEGGYNLDVLENSVVAHLSALQE